MLESLKVVLTFESLWTKSYDVTIQMKPLCLYFQMALFVFKILQNKIWEFFVEFCPLSTLGTERVKPPILIQTQTNSCCSRKEMVKIF